MSNILKPDSRQGGFTLIEVVIVVVIIGITAALAAPDFVASYKRYQLKQATRTLASRLSDARLAAINQGSVMTVVMSQPPATPQGVTATFNGRVGLSPETFSPEVVTFILPQAGPIGFNSRGQSISPGPQTIQLFIQNNAVGYSVTVNPVGKVSWCLQQVAACP
ncbi:MAG: prepilin-type N-terminal cleavage/methylation domain-containing protein [Nitrospirae bacterium]|nr:prepilin-type N-terminal cleavage/methylation domain-containing protein [Nitrospirota bacterium]